MEKDAPPLCYARPRDDDLLEWYVFIPHPGTSSCADRQARRTRAASTGDSFSFLKTIHSNLRTYQALIQGHQASDTKRPVRAGYQDLHGRLAT